MNDISDKEFAVLRDYIKQSFGINLGDEKKSFIYARLRTILREQGCDDFMQYYQHLQKDTTGNLVADFVNKITTNHTFFMREAEHFTYLKETVLPRIEKSRADQKDIRLWCAGCSSGEESYTLECLLMDYFANDWNTEILATDISTAMLEKAVCGVYANQSVESLPAAWQSKYFTKYNEASSIVTSTVKKNITYRSFNLMTDFPFKQKFQIIFCRNVMIYFDSDTRESLIKKFYDMTDKNGYLFIGHAESLNQNSTDYKYIMPAVYQRK